MSCWVVVATGQSLKASDVKYLRGKAKVIVVSNAYKLAPWAQCMASCDRAWWANNKDAFEFPGDKYSHKLIAGLKHFKPECAPSDANSGLYAMHLAQHLGATKIILLGFDMWGTHYFGKHPEPLKNSTEINFRRHIAQFETWAGCEVINCTPGSALKLFPAAKLQEVL